MSEGNTKILPELGSGRGTGEAGGGAAACTAITFPDSMLRRILGAGKT